MKTSEVMTRTKFLKHCDKMILNFDFSGLEVDEARQVCEYVKGLISRMPLGSVLTLVNVTNVQYNQEFKELSSDLAKHNKPYVLAGAVIGVEGWKKMVLWATTKLTGRDNLKAFDSIEAAKDWLVNYQPK